MNMSPDTDREIPAYTGMTEQGRKNDGAGPQE